MHDKGVTDMARDLSIYVLEEWMDCDDAIWVVPMQCLDMTRGECFYGHVIIDV